MRTRSPAGSARLPIALLGRSLVRFEGEGAGGSGGAAPPQPPQQPPAPAPFAVFPDADTFTKRMEREAKRILKEQGIEDPAAVKAQLDEYTKLKAAQEEQRKQQLSEVERMREERNAFEAAQAKAMGRAEEAELRAHLYKVFAETGIRNFEYAFWAVTNKLGSLGETEELDERAWLAEQLKDPTQAAAYGYAAAQAPRQVPLTNTDPSKGPVAPPAGGQPSGQPGDAFGLNKDQFAADLQKRYGFTPMNG
jgi:hypothetical protein